MKIELKINGKAIELSEETKEQIKKACGQVKLRPTMEEKYWAITGGEVGSFYFDGGLIDNNIWNAGNGFFTKEEAQKELAKRQAIQRVKDYILENGMYYEPDWDNGNEKYFFASYRGKTQIHNFCSNKCYSPIGYLKSNEDAEKVLEDNKEDLEIIFK
ncbi:MAG: hypothetical protein RBR97_20180 [Bacteroidales bacterium]|nr:hypothetical protein [Bacteroidales bacterium]